ncbi:MAG TPA: 2-hydroxy-3-oxopropionate reductase [Terriglobia bacterium]|nr:2-hydroxy-3-oxopropionate reductase [Terriglobia bacterium]
MKKIGFIGLGIMGRPMAKNLLRAGYSLVVFDINPEPVKELVALGAVEAASPKQVAQQCKYLITMLPNSPEVKEVVCGARGILEGAEPSTILIDMSSISPIVSRELGETLKQKGIEFLDAPVSGGEPKAIDATLSIMVGGEEGVFNRCLDILQVIGKSVVRVGEVGSGNVTKLANQVIVALNIAAMSEAFVLGTKAGVDPALIFNAIRGGLAGSTVMEAKAMRSMEGNFEPGFKIDLHIKDLANALDTGRQIGAPLFLTAQVMEILKCLKLDGKGQKDHSAILNYYEKLAGVEVRRKT